MELVYKTFVILLILISFVYIYIKSIKINNKHVDECNSLIHDINVNYDKERHINEYLNLRKNSLIHSTKLNEIRIMIEFKYDIKMITYFGQ